ncbi:MAG TPA: S8 family serine peptidase [Thermoanaerobaculia bacterium]|nr:S8 family serine peptidase [Thermoanaerobaculia bacterium]
MKRTAIGAVFLLLTVSSYGAEARRYLVGTKRAAKKTSVAILADSVGEADDRDVQTFSVIDGFAADLTPEEAAALRRSPEVRWVEPVAARQLAASAVKPGEQVMSYGVTQVHAPEAWLGRRVNGNINVAVIDSGVDWRHPDLAGSYAGGYHVLDKNDRPMDDVGHGTHVAGIIAAANNAYGVVGVAPGMRLWGLKIVDKNGEGYTEDLITAIEWVMAKKKEVGGQWVVNMSLGGTDSSIGERETFLKAADAGILMVGSSGNTSTASAISAVEFPAAYPELLAVGAVNETENRVNFSNGGPELDFVAPGMHIVSTVISGETFASYVRADNTIILTKPATGAKTGNIAGEYVYCGLGAAGDFPASVKGKIALIKRGVDTFADKARRAIAAGAIAVVFFNHDDSNYSFTLLPPEDPDAKNVAWPIAVGMPKAPGDQLAAKGSGTMTIEYTSDDYGQKNGTSMSAPHVTGAVALLWSMAPDATPAQITNALITTARDLGEPGRDDLYGYGGIDVFAAAKMLVPSAFETTGRRILTRRRH